MVFSLRESESFPILLHSASFYSEWRSCRRAPQRELGSGDRAGYRPGAARGARRAGLPRDVPLTEGAVSERSVQAGSVMSQETLMLRGCRRRSVLILRRGPDAAPRNHRTLRPDYTQREEQAVGIL